MARGYSSFKDFFASEEISVHREIEVAVHNDENIANNRLFVWNFEEADLEEFLQYFQIYKDSSINIATRQNLSSNLMRKMNAMMREGYNPVECMLYASKIINMKLQNDKELQEILAERIKDVYIKQEAETIAVLENIIKMWTWVPQVRVVITAIGLIGDNQELLDNIVINYAHDPNYKTKVFYALMQNKSLSNLERVLKIIMSLQDLEEDMVLGKVFIREISGFGYEGSKILAKYYDNPAMTRAGARVIRKIMSKNDTGLDINQDDELYRRTLASKSNKDDLAYKDFLDDCYEKYDDEAFYLSRFSRPEIGAFLKSAIEDDRVSARSKNIAIVSLGIIGVKGYTPAETVLSACGRRGENNYAVIVSQILLSNQEAAEKLADIFCMKKDYELSELYSVLRTASIVNYRYAIELIADAIERKFRSLLESESYDAYEQLDCLTSNLQMFWDKKVYFLLSKEILEDMCSVLNVYAKNTVDVPQAIIVSIIETLVYSWNTDVEKTFFDLYKKSENRKVQELSFKKLKERKIEAPK